VSGSRTFAGPRPQKAEARPVSRPGDRHEREAERAAEVVARGGSVSGWSFSAVPPSAPAPVQRQEKGGGEKSEDEKYKEALKKAGEAALETEEGKAVKEKVLADPVVKAVTSPYVLVPGIAGGVAALAATGKELPVQPPAIPLEKVSPALAGIEAQITYEGPVNRPTFVGLTITVSEQGPKGKKKPDPIAAETARLKAQDEMFRKGMRYAPGSKEAEEQRLLDQAVQNYVLRNSTLPGFTIPLTPPPKKEEKKEETPVQRASASSAHEAAGGVYVDDVLTSPGRPLDPSARRAMEARFGVDFSGVRVHDDARAAASAAELDAAAFTVGDDVVFGSGRYDPAGYEGRRLLAHELAHVVQQSHGNEAHEKDSGIKGAHARGDHTRAAELIRARKHGGVALPPDLRSGLGRHLGYDFGAVRIHADSFADATATDLDANAFTLGNDIFFAAGMYAPDRPVGLVRLAHELAHTIQQGGSAPAVDVNERLEDEAERAAFVGAAQPLSRVAPAVMREPTYPRRTTGNAMIREAERILNTTRDPAAVDATTRLWSQVQSNFSGSITAGTIARRIWSFIFLRHFTEPEPRPGVESVHPRYLYSTTYGWIDGQHFFGFIDFADQQLASHPNDRDEALRAATQQGIDIEAKQQQARDYVILGAPPATDVTRLMQVRPPNTPLFRVPQYVAGAGAEFAANVIATLRLTGTQRELFGLLNERQRQKFWLDSAKSAWSYEDIVSNQLGIRFFFAHGTRINGLAPAAREPEFLAALSTFFGDIGVENDQQRLDDQARTLPMKERYERPTTTEERERQRHPELFRLPAQRAPASTAPAPAYADVDSALASPGRPLDPSTRRAMEAHFGYDFSGVRVHDDARAAASAAALDAVAFTVGQDIAFGPGRYAPSTTAGREILAHELAHTIQQRRTGRRVDRQQGQQGQQAAGAAPSFSVSQQTYEQLVQQALRALSGRLPSVITFASVVVPILQAMSAQVTWRDASGGDHGGGVHDYAVPGTKTVLRLRLVLDDMVDPPEAGQFDSHGKNGTIFVRVRKSATAEELTEVLYHESMHMVSWIINEHGGAAAVSGIERRAVRGLTRRHHAAQTAGVLRQLENLSAGVNSRRRAARRAEIKHDALERMAEWLMDEVQVRAETEVLQQTLQVESQRGQRAQVYMPTQQYGSINTAMVDKYVFEFSRTFTPDDRAGLTADDRETLRILTDMMEGSFQLHVRRRFSLTAYTMTVPRERPRIPLTPLTPPSFLPRIGAATREEPF